MDGIVRANIKPGMLVAIILKKDQRTGVLTEGIVKNILTSALLSVVFITFHLPTSKQLKIIGLLAFVCD